MTCTIEPIRIGDIFCHHSGRIYEVVNLANIAAPSDKFLPTVVYVDVENQVWSRPMTEFLSNFVRIGATA